MTQPVAYEPIASFREDETNSLSGRSMIATEKLDVELQNIATTLTGTLASLLQIQRDDGLLKDGLVRSWNLAADTLLLIGSTFTPRGQWAALTAYQVGDIVENAGTGYVAATAHTATANFANDRASGFWIAFSPLVGAAALMTITPLTNIPGPDLQSALGQISTLLAASKIAADLYVRNTFGGL